MASQTVENYLKALLVLANEKGEVSISELSKSLDVKTPTANSMVKKLSEQGMLSYEKYKPLSLTQSGKKAAALILRRHRLTEMFLVEKMGFGWEEVHVIAEQIEHIQSEAFFERMDELLGSPTIDPHGSPIPDKDGVMVKRSYEKLIQYKPGQKVRLSAITNSSVEFLHFLNSRKLALGQVLEIISIEAFDGSMVVYYNQEKDVSLSKMVCQNLLVELIGPN